MLTAYCSTLEPLDRDALEESICILAAFIVGSDRSFDEMEMAATVECLAEAEAVLGPEFRSSPAASAAFDHLTRNAMDRGLDFFQQKLDRVATIVRQMPPELAQEYRSFVGRMCARLAGASGRVLWFGEAINQEEREALRLIGNALGIVFAPAT